MNRSDTKLLGVLAGAAIGAVVLFVTGYAGRSSIGLLATLILIAVVVIVLLVRNRDGTRTSTDRDRF